MQVRVQPVQLASHGGADLVRRGKPEPCLVHLIHPTHRNVNLGLSFYRRHKQPTQRRPRSPPCIVDLRFLDCRIFLISLLQRLRNDEKSRAEYEKIEPENEPKDEEDDESGYSDDEFEHTAVVAWGKMNKPPLVICIHFFTY